MADQILIVLAVIVVIIVLWWLLKAILKLTVKVFSCGLVLILIVGAIILLTSGNIEAFLPW